MMNIISCYCNLRLSFWNWYILIWTSTFKSIHIFLWKIYVKLLIKFFRCQFVDEIQSIKSLMKYKMCSHFSIDGDCSKYCAWVGRPSNIPHLVIMTVIIITIKHSICWSWLWLWIWLWLWLRFSLWSWMIIFEYDNDYIHD